MMMLLLRARPEGIQKQHRNTCETLLHCACMYDGPPPIIGCFLQAWPDGAIVTNQIGETVLHILALSAATTTTLTNVKLILMARLGAAKLRNYYGQLPLYVAVESLCAPVLECLVDKWPATINIRNCTGRLPIERGSDSQVYLKWRNC